MDEKYIYVYDPKHSILNRNTFYFKYGKIYPFCYILGLLLYALVFFLNYILNPFYLAFIQIWNEAEWKKYIWCNFYLTLWYVPCGVLLIQIVNIVCEIFQIRKLGKYGHNMLGIFVCSIQNSYLPVFLFNLILLLSIQ